MAYGLHLYVHDPVFYFLVAVFKSDSRLYVLQNKAFDFLIPLTDVLFANCLVTKPLVFVFI
jgi:hypothetical protein